MSLPQVRREIEPGHARHLQVGHEEVDGVVPGKRSGFLGRGRNDGAPALESRAMAIIAPTMGSSSTTRAIGCEPSTAHRPGSCRRVEPTPKTSRGDRHVRIRLGTHERHGAGMHRACHDGPSCREEDLQPGAGAGGQPEGRRPTVALAGHGDVLAGTGGPGEASRRPAGKRGEHLEAGKHGQVVQGGGRGFVVRQAEHGEQRRTGVRPALRVVVADEEPERGRRRRPRARVGAARGPRCPRVAPPRPGG